MKLILFHTQTHTGLASVSAALCMCECVCHRTTRAGSNNNANKMRLPALPKLPRCCCSDPLNSAAISAIQSNQKWMALVEGVSLQPNMRRNFLRNNRPWRPHQEPEQFQNSHFRSGCCLRAPSVSLQIGKDLNECVFPACRGLLDARST